MVFSLAIVSALVATAVSSVSASALPTEDMIANTTTSRRLADVAYSARSLDMPGNDLFNAPASRADNCFAICKTNARCRAYTWTNYNGGTCYFKTYWAKPVIKVGADSAVLLEKAQGIISQGYRASYDNCDMPGFDMGTESGKDVWACERACWGNFRCKAVTWTNYNGGTCFYKSDVRACAPLAGAITRVVYNHLVTA